MGECSDDDEHVEEVVTLANVVQAVVEMSLRELCRVHDCSKNVDRSTKSPVLNMRVSYQFSFNEGNGNKLDGGAQATPDVEGSSEGLVLMGVELLLERDHKTNCAYQGD